MDKKEMFKEFAKNHPQLINYLNNNPDMSWQKLYEIYDIYGEDEGIWNKYVKNTNNISDMFKNVDMNKIQEHINNAQKALNVIGELTKSGASTIENIKGPTIPRPLTKFFGD